MIIITYDQRGGVRGLYAWRVGKYGGYMKYVGCAHIRVSAGYMAGPPAYQTSRPPPPQGPYVRCQDSVRVDIDSLKINFIICMETYRGGQVGPQNY